MTARPVESPDLAALLAGADHLDLHRLVWAVVAMHEPDRTGRCRYCRRERRRPRVAGWRRRQSRACRTTRLIVAQLSTAGYRVGSV